jgi:S1-C subfamily serine protease
VTLSDQTSLPATMVREDPDLDLALLRIKGEKPFPFLDTTRLSPNLLGQTVVAIGNPVGYESSVSLGILSAKDRNLTIGDFTYDALLQTDAAINPGNSGGPLVDVAGQFVGLNTAKMAASLVGGTNVPVEKIGFAIPADRVKAFVQDAIEIAEGRKPAPPEVSLADQVRDKLGLHLQEVDNDLGREFGIRPGSGLLIVKVEAGSPAENVGIEQGMVLIGLGASRLSTMEDLPRSILRLKKGDKIKATLLIFQRRGAMLMQRTAAVELELKK